MKMFEVSSFRFQVSSNAGTAAQTRNSKLETRNPRAFSLLEVLIATLILGIGLIMVAAIFPVGAKWSQQGAEETIAQNLALNAVSIIKTKYTSTLLTTAPTGANKATDAYYASGTWKTGAGTAITSTLPQVYCLPDFATTVPISEPHLCSWDRPAFSRSCDTLPRCAIFLDCID